MSQDYSTIKNKHPKVRFTQYLPNPNEPRGVASRDSLAEFEADLAENIPRMRRYFRSIALRLRNRHALRPEAHTTKRQDSFKHHEQLRIERHYAEAAQNDEREMIALNTKVSKLKTTINLKRQKQGLHPLA